jgi:hypothetical protein
LQEFKELDIDSIQSATPQATEQKLLEQILLGSQYKPQDIVAIGIASQHKFHFEKPKMDVIYLTEKGMQEKDDPAQVASYEEIKKSVPTADYIMPIQNGLKTIVTAHNGNDFIDPAEISYVPLKGPDNKQRIMLVYTRDTTKLSF